MEYEALSPEYKNTYSRSINLFKFIGIDISKPGISISCMMRLFVTIVIFLPFFGGQLSLVAGMSADKFLEDSRCIPMCTFGVLCTLKMVTALAKKSEIEQMIIDIGDMWPRDDDNNEKTFIKKTWVRRIRTLENAFFMYVLVNVFSFVMFPLLTTVYNLLAGVDQLVFPFQMAGLWPADSVTSYLASYVWAVAATVPDQMCLYLPYDLLIVRMTSNISILLRLLQVDLINSIEAHDVGVRLEVRSPDTESYERILTVMKKHQKLLRMSEQLNNIFGLEIFVHVGFSSVMICFFGFLTVVFGGLAETTANLLTAWNAVIAIFLISLSGQLLCDTSSGLAEAAYQSKWYESDIKVKKLILFIIIRSQKTCYLTALGFSKMTLKTFSTIMSSSWTYFSFLVQMYKK